MLCCGVLCRAVPCFVVLYDILSYYIIEHHILDFNVMPKTASLKQQMKCNIFKSSSSIKSSKSLGAAVRNFVHCKKEKLRITTFSPSKILNEIPFSAGGKPGLRNKISKISNHA